MKTYSVKEVANMLGTSEETVRRWIRAGKLSAKINSRKEGCVITDTMLKAFVRSSPKYSTSLLTPVGGLIAASTFILGSIIEKAVNKSAAIKESSIDETEVKRLLRSDLEKTKENIKSKKNTIDQLEKEIQEEEQKIRSIELLLEDYSIEKLIEGLSGKDNSTE